MADAADTKLDETAGRQRLAKLYAEALFAAAAERGQADVVGDELAALVSDVLAREPRVAAFLASPAIGRKTKTDALQSAAGLLSSDLLRNLLGVLDKNGRLGSIKGIAVAYRAIREARAGRVPVRVTSAVPLTDHQRHELIAALASRLGKTPVLAEAVDPDILGGLIVRVGDRVTDSSVRTRLDTLRTQLLSQSGNYVLQN
jgi:F-type H+-transporting ATPase subunit delta